MRRALPIRLPRAFAAVIVGALLLPASASAAEEWPLSGYWPLFESRGQEVRDISGRGNHGRLGRTDAPDKHDAEWIRGLYGVGSALRLDGNDYVAMPETATMRPQRVSVEGWVRAPRSPGQFKYVVVKGGDRCEAGSFGLYTSINGGMAFYVYDGRKWWRSPMVGTALWDGDWHHVAGSYDGTRVRLFVDGWEIGAGTPFSGRIEYDLANRQAYLGAFRGTCDLTFTGDVDELRIWSASIPFATIWARIRQFVHREPAAPLPEDAREWYEGILPT